jgi:hypothetical protein
MREKVDRSELNALFFHYFIFDDLFFAKLAVNIKNIEEPKIAFYISTEHKLNFCSHVEGGKKVACICAAPTVLKQAGVLPSKYTAHQSVAEALPDILPDSCVIDGNIITSRGAGTAIEFGLKIVHELVGKAKADSISAAIHFT